MAMVTGVWGWDPQRGPGAEPLVGGQGAKPSEAEAESFLALERPTKPQNLPSFLGFFCKVFHLCLPA